MGVENSIAPILLEEVLEPAATQELLKKKKIGALNWP